MSKIIKVYNVEINTAVTSFMYRLNFPYQQHKE